MLNRVLRRYFSEADSLLKRNKFVEARQLYREEISLLNQSECLVTDKIHLLKRHAACDFKIKNYRSVNNILKKCIEILLISEGKEIINEDIVEAQKQTYEEMVVLELMNDPQKALDMSEEFINKTFNIDFIRTMKFYSLIAGILCNQLHISKNHFQTILDDVTDNLSLGMLYNNAGVVYWLDELEIEDPNILYKINHIEDIKELNYILNLFENAIHFFERQYYEIKKDRKEQNPYKFEEIEEQIRFLLFEPTPFDVLESKIGRKNIIDLFNNPLSAIPLLNIAEIFINNQNPHLMDHGKLCLHLAFEMLYKTLKNIDAFKLSNSKRIQGFYLNYESKYRSCFIKVLTMMAQFAKSKVI